MSQIYTDAILRHSKTPQNFVGQVGMREPGWFTVAGKFPSCSENIILYIRYTGEIIDDVKWTGSGSTILIASASISSQHVIGKSFSDAFVWADKVFTGFSTKTLELDQLGDIALLEPVKDYPRRVKSAILPAHTIKLAISKIRAQHAR